MKLNRYYCLILIVPILLIVHNLAKAKDNYPKLYREAPKDSLFDPFAIPNRECTSYVSWEVYQMYHLNLHGLGPAQLWPQTALAKGYPVDSNPEDYSIAINKSFFPGHAMWVEKDYKNGTILVSDYNHDNKGNYSRRTVSSSGLVYIHFMHDHAQP